LVKHPEVLCPKICPRYPQDIPNISPRHPQHILNISSKKNRRRMVSPNVTTPLAVPDECPFGQHGCIPAGCIAAVKPEFYEFPTRATCILDVFYVASKLFYVEVLR